jgi:hypothetical protein
MDIDLTKVLNSGNYGHGFIDEYREKSKIIFDKIYNYRDYNSMIIPIHVYNIISTDNRFIDTLMILGDSNEMRKVGEICGYQCYVDIYMDPFEILLTYDLNMIRDNKIDYLISNKDILKEKKVRIIS